jgi:DNA-binding NtrC family response regulator
MMIAYISAETTVTAMKEGAYDHLSSPFKYKYIQQIVKNTLERRKLSAENWFLRNILNDRFQVSNIIGKSEPIQKIFDLVEKLPKAGQTY